MLVEQEGAGYGVFSVRFQENAPPEFERLAGPFATEQQAEGFAARMQKTISGKEVT